MPKPSTVDRDEVLYYKRLANEWWDEQGKFWPLHRLNRLREVYLKQHICAHFGRDSCATDPLEGLTVIDIGCGGGILSESMARLGASVTGIDVVAKSLKVAEQHSFHQRLRIEYLNCTAEELAESGVQFDVVLNMEVVEHVVELPTFISSCARLMKPGGIMFIATINRNPMSWLFAIAGAEYILGWLPRGTHQWSKFVKPSELVDLLGRHQLFKKSMTGVSINPITRHFSLSKRSPVNYMVSATSKQEYN